MSSNNVLWKDKWIEITAKIYAIGGTTDTIAKTLNSLYNTNFTKNSVIGKINRQRAAGDKRFLEPKPEKVNGKPIQSMLQLWKEGVSSTDISERFGICRDTVSRKASEYGLKKRPVNHHAKKQKEARKEVKKFAFTPYKVANTFANPNALGLDLININHGQCRFAIGDGPFLFCGLPVEIGSSVPYCPDCKKIMYEPRTK